MIRRSAPLIAMLLLGPQVQACSRWTVADETMDHIAKSKDELRVDTADSNRIEIRYPHAASDTLFGELKRIRSHRSSPGKPLLLIPKSRVPGEDALVKIARVNLDAVYVLRAEGWVKTTQSLEQFVPTEPRILVELNRGPNLELWNWHVTPDSLYGQPTTSQPQPVDWVAIPRSEIQRISYRQADVPRMILLGLGVAALSLLALYGIALSTGSPGD